MLTFISFIFVFGIIVIAHEFGHFITALKSGIRIHEFSMGMGPALFSKQKGEILYSVRALPIGGYVKMEGEDGESDDPRSFGKKSTWTRLLVLAAGALTNFILAFLLLIIVMFGVGAASNALESVAQDKPAAEAGLLAGDRIVAIDGAATDTWNSVVETINGSEGKMLTLTVERDGETLTLYVTPEQESDGVYRIGIQTHVEKNIGQAFSMAATTFWTFFTDIFRFFTQIGSKNVAGELMGPVGLVNLIGETSRQGIWSLLYLAAYISINLGIFNLLPFPALDGGRIVFLVIEMIKGSPVNPEKEAYVHFAGFVVLILLMVALTFKDLSII
ncbi:MAG: regulator of sigma protease [Clostridiales bacterium]|jgi:regulator of sigma E protease|nr:regulator of sigma protease [Clostridiales bacterium]